MKNPWVIIAVLTVVLFGGAILLSQGGSSKNNEGVQRLEHVTGNPDSSIVLEEFADLQCPACASFAPVVDEVLSQFGDAIRYEYKQFPLPMHQYALQAGVAAEAAAQQGKFFEFTHVVFQNQDTWAKSRVPGSFFEQYATDLGMDVEQFKRQSQSTELRDYVKEQMAEGRDRGVAGTPTFYLNGQLMEYSTVEEFLTQIAAAVGGTGTSTASGVEFGVQ
ncbi:thioredoxin domain-containing protein [Candidatus Kaiserbacteria bacterium]|nr:thioredoxin domain-containing protein [Candidatus Kaiserbacteria bacterium]